MNAQNYTQKSLEAIQAAQKLTIENQNQQIEQIHLLAALLKQENGLVFIIVLYPEFVKGEQGRKL